MYANRPSCGGLSSGLLFGAHNRKEKQEMNNQTVSHKKNNIVVGCTFELKGGIISDYQIEKLREIGIYPLTYQITKRRKC